MSNCNDEGQRPIMTSMGMFIVDEIHFTDANIPPAYDVIGGAGTYTGLGARLFLTGPKQSQKSCWFVDMGYDFPETVKLELESWNAGILFRETKERATTRGWNKYGDHEERGFKYMTPKLRIEVDDIISNQRLLSSQSFHLICSPSRCVGIINKLRRESASSNFVIIWEPVPTECSLETRSECVKALGDIDIFSPNANEAAMFWGAPEPFTIAEIEAMAKRFLPYLVKPNAAMVLRCGDLGCLVMQSSVMNWYPAYHTNGDKVVDPTGGGNTFLGGFAAGYVLNDKDCQQGAIFGNVAAGLAIEQIGFPKLSHDERGNELWNGSRVSDRVIEYCKVNNLSV